MHRISQGFGLALILAGVAGYLHTGRESATALIPAGIGLGLFLCGLWARVPGKRKAAMHVAVVLALVGAIGSGPRLFRGLSSDGLGMKQAYMLAAFSLCALFVVLCVRSFVAARKA